MIRKANRTDSDQHRSNSAKPGVARTRECHLIGRMTTRFFVARFDNTSCRLPPTDFGWTKSGQEAQRRVWIDLRHLIENLAELAAGDLPEVRGQPVGIGRRPFAARFLPS
jgi:acyl-CoA thioester hydrolase